MCKSYQSNILLHVQGVTEIPCTILSVTWVVQVNLSKWQSLTILYSYSLKFGRLSYDQRLGRFTLYIYKGTFFNTTESVIAKKRDFCAFKLRLNDAASDKKSILLTMGWKFYPEQYHSYVTWNEYENLSVSK